MFVTGCGTYSSSSVPITYTVGGTVSGLAGSGLVLQDNGGNNLAVSANGSFTFTTALASGTAYSVTVFSQPINPIQTCVVTSGSGTLTSNVTNVSVACTTNALTVGGTVSGLKGTGLVLQDNGGNNLTVSANGSFTFATALATGTTYSVTVSTQPTNPSQICSVTSGSGIVTITAINTVAVKCLTTTNSLIVSDFGNNRVLIYNTPFSAGQSANVVLGQTNFTTATAGTTASTMNAPSAAAMDSAGNLYVAENSNCRVTQFKSPFSNGMSASLVFGQPGLNTGNCAASISASSLGGAGTGDEVFGVIADSSGNLWVADSGSNRVVEYKPPFSNGMVATLAIGQANLTSGSANQGGAAPTNATLYDPGNPVFDSSGNLWIPDFVNARMLEFKPPFATGMAASVVLGQANFTSGNPNQSVVQGAAPGANTLSGTDGAAFDSSGNLWMADANNNRVLEFVPPFTTNMAASLVIGQVNLTSGLANQGGAGPTSATLNFPQQVSFDSSGRLFVNDDGNNRTLVFAPPFSNGMNASFVIGQADFTSATPATTAAGQNSPTGVITAPPL